MDRVVVVGGGAREHALAWALAKSPHVLSVTAVPGNAGMELDGSATVRPDVSWEALPDWTEGHADLVVIGPEAPLADGLADRIRARGVAVLGPGAEGARLEASKSWAKTVMAHSGIPTAEAVPVRTLEEAERLLQNLSGPIVVKADGLAAGKGVTVAANRAAAREAVRELLGGRVGSAGSLVLIEECLSGPEVSCMVVTDGERYQWLPPAQDYKRLSGAPDAPNTGGMGALAPAVGWTASLQAVVADRIIEPLLARLRSLGIAYRGVLYAGLMLTPQGPMVLEWNCRFGDPEAAVLLPIMRTDLWPALHGAAVGRLPSEPLQWSGTAVGVVMAAPGYPNHPVPNLPVTVDRSVPGALVFHAGTKREGSQLRSTGGRTLTVVGCGEQLPAARAVAYRQVDAITFPGALVRRDIAASDSQT